MNKSKEKQRMKNTKDENLFDLDNEIIIGMKTLPEKKEVKRKKTSKKEEEKSVRKSKTSKKKKLGKDNRSSYKEKSRSGSKTKVNRKPINTARTRNIEDNEFELKLGIEDEEIKRKYAKNKPRKTTKQQEIARKKRKRIFRAVKWTTLVALIVGGGIYFLLSPFFNIKTINVKGNEKITSDEIINLSNINLDENTFKISKSKAEEGIKTNSYIEDVKIKRNLPDGIEIEVVERKPAYMILIGNAYVYVNTQGYLLEVSKEALNLPVIVGYSTPQEQIQEGNRLVTEDLQKLNSVIQIMNSATNNEIANLITKINIENKQDYVLEFKSEKKSAHLGDTSNLSTKMLYIKTLLQKEKKKEGDIFVNTDLSNKGAIFREKV